MNGSKRYLVDTNGILRFLTDETVPQATAARQLFARGTQRRNRAGDFAAHCRRGHVHNGVFLRISEPREAAIKLSYLIQQSGVKLHFADAYVAAGTSEDR